MYIGITKAIQKKYRIDPLQRTVEEKYDEQQNR